MLLQEESRVSHAKRYARLIVKLLLQESNAVLALDHQLLHWVVIESCRNSLSISPSVIAIALNWMVGIIIFVGTKEIKLLTPISLRGE